MKKFSCLLLSLMLLMALAVGCQSPSAGNPEGTLEPVTANENPVSSADPSPAATNSETTAPVVEIESLGKKLTYDTVPERVVALGYDLAEELVMLGLEDKIIAVAPSMYLLEDVKPEYRDQIKDIPVLPDGHSQGVPTLETVLGQNPDFVLGYSYSFSDKSAGTVDDYIGSRIHFYATEGTYISNATIENTYNDFINLGKIFRVEDQANKVVENMRSKAAAVAQKLTDAGAVPAFIFDSGSADRLYTIGGTGFQNNLVKMAGGKNIFEDLQKDFADVSMEELVARNPEAIIIVEYYTADLGKEKIGFLESAPELQNVEAVKNKNFIVISGYSFFPCGQNIDLVEQMAKGLHPDVFK